MGDSLELVATVVVGGQKLGERGELRQVCEPVLPGLGHLHVACTKGTYVRTLVHDLGRKLGCGAHLASLRRLSSGRFNVTDALTLERALALSAGELEKRVIPFLTLATAG